MTRESHHGHFPHLPLEAIRQECPYTASEIVNKPCHYQELLLRKMLCRISYQCCIRESHSRWAAEKGLLMH